MRARRAGTREAAPIAQLISHYADQGRLLPRSESEIREQVDRFLVLTAKGRVLGCLSLEGYGPKLAEVRSLAVDPESRRRGPGARLVEFAPADARRREIAQVFAVTDAPEFFLRQGFTGTRRRSLDQKMERDCSACPKRRSCWLSAVIATLIPERADLAVLGEAAHAIPAA